MSPDTPRGHGETAQLIRSEAFRLFSQHGYAGTSIRTVAKAAGVSPGVVTYHYPKKNDLYVAALEEPYDRFIALLGEVLDDPGRTPGQRLRNLIERLSSLDDEMLALLSLLLRQALDNAEPLQALAPRFVSGHLALLSRAVNDALGSGELPSYLDLGVIPIMAGGILFPQLLRAASRNVPALRMVVDFVVARAKDNLVKLLGLEP